MNRWKALVCFPLLLLLCMGSIQSLSGEDPVEPMALPSVSFLDAQWLRLAPDQVPEALAKARQGTFIRLSRKELEQRIKKAAQSRALPQLIEAHYQATLQEPSFQGNGSPPLAQGISLKGSGLWKVRARGNGNQVLSLWPCSFALQSARFQNEMAMVGDFTNGQPGILIPEPGDHEVNLEWTLRGDPTPEGIQFDWRAPASPVAILELTVPKGRNVTVSPDSCLLTGPLPAAQPGQSRWRIGFSGHARIHLVVSQAVNPKRQKSPVILVRSRSTQQKLTASGQQCTFDFEVEARGQGRSTLIFDHDRSLRPYQVEALNLESWKPLPAGKNGKPALALQFRRAQTGTIRLRIHCQAPLDPGAKAQGLHDAISWVSPEMRLRNGAEPGLTGATETLEIVVPPELRLQEWHPGSFELREIQNRIDGAHHFHLRRMAFPSRESIQGKGKGRPSASIRFLESLYRAEVALEWHPGSGGEGSALTAQIRYQVRQGQLFELPLLLPTTYEVDRILLSPSGRSLQWTQKKVAAAEYPQLLGLRARSRRSATLVTVNLQEPLRSGTSPSGNGSPLPVLTLRLRPLASQSSPRPGKSWKRLFPFCAPVGAASAVGELGIHWDRREHRAQFSELTMPFGNRLSKAVLASARPLRPERSQVAGPWGATPPEALFSWKEIPLVGVMQLQPTGLDLRARASTQVRMAPATNRRSDLEMEARISVENRCGETSTLECQISGSDKLTWEWYLQSEPSSRGKPVALSAQRLPSPALLSTWGMAASAPWQSSTLLALPPSSQWLLRLPKPLLSGESVELIVRGKVSALSHRKQTFWSVPLVSLTANSFLGTVRLPLVAGQDRGNRKPLRMAAEISGTGPALLAPARSRPGEQWYRYQGGHAQLIAYPGKPVSETVNVDQEPGSRELTSQILRAILTTQVQPDSTSLVHSLILDVEEWDRPELSVSLPLALASQAKLHRVLIDGRRAPSLTEFTKTEESYALTLPVPLIAEKDRKGIRHRFEILFSTSIPPWSRWGEIPSIVPQLPVEPLSFRRVWRLPRELMPLSTSGLVRLTPGRSSSTWTEWSFLDPFSEVNKKRNQLRRQVNALQIADQSLSERAGGQSWTLGRVISFLAFQELQPHRIPLVIDRKALQQQGLSAQKLLRLPDPDRREESASLRSLEPWALVVVPLPQAPVLTTRGVQERWEQAGLLKSSSTSLAISVADSLQYGQDPSGRFCTALTWLREQGEVEPEWLHPLTLARDASFSDWEESGEPLASLLIVRRDLPARLGIGLALFLLLLAWGVSQRFAIRSRFEKEPGTEEQAIVVSRRRACLALLLLWLGLGGLAWLWLPDALTPVAGWPLLVGCGVALLWYLRPGESVQSSQTVVRQPRARTATATGMIALFWLTLSISVSDGPSPYHPGRRGEGSGDAQTPSPSRMAFQPTTIAGPAIEESSFDPGPPEPSSDRKIYLLGPELRPEEQTVLISPTLLKRMEQLSRQSTLREAILIDARMNGFVKDNKEALVHFEAVYQVYCTTKDRCLVHIPLEGRGLRLTKEVLVDGARGWPVVAKAPRLGYLIPVKGIGKHTVRFTFAVPVQKESSARSIAFTVPRVPQSQAKLTVPRGARWMECLMCLGAQHFTEDNESSHLQVDQGPVARTEAKAEATAMASGTATMPFLLRWRRSQPGPGLTFQFREGWLWDLQAKEQTLTGVVQCRLGDQPTSRLQFSLPQGLSVERVEVRREPSLTSPVRDPASQQTGNTLVRLRDWDLENRGRDELMLNLSLQRPVTGTIRVLLRLVPYRTGQGTPRDDLIVPLPIPRPMGEPLKAGGFVAYRTEGMEVDVRRPLRLSEVNPGSMPAFFWQTLGGNPGKIAAEYQIQLNRRVRPLLVVGFQRDQSKQSARQTLTWQLSERRADVRANVKLTSEQSDLTVIQYQVPEAVHLTRIEGPLVRQWTRSGNQAQIWLRRSSAQAEITIHGWVAWPKADLKKYQKGKPFLFSVPLLRPAGTAVHTEIHFEAMQDLALSAENVEQLSTLAGSVLSERQMAYETSKLSYPAVIRVGHAKLPVAQSYTELKVLQRHVHLLSWAQVSVSDSELRSVEMVIRDWPGKEVTLKAPNGSRVVELGSRPDEKRWIVYFPPGLQNAAIRAQGRAAIESVNGGLSMPRLELPTIRRHQPWMAVRGNALSITERRGLELAEGRPAGWPAAWHPPSRSELKLYQATSDEWQMGLELRPELTATATIQSVHVEQQALPGMGFQWVHELRWWFFLEEEGWLDIQLPQLNQQHALMKDVHLDGKRPEAFRIRRGPPGQISVSLRDSGPHYLCVRWSWPSGVESWWQPCLRRPQLQDHVLPLSACMIALPSGTVPQSSSALRSGPLVQAEVAIARAEAQLRLSELLSAQTSRLSIEAELEPCQMRFYLHCRNGEHLILASGDGGDVKEASALTSHLQFLLERNRALAEKQGWKALSTRIEAQVRGGTVESALTSAQPGALILRGLPHYLALQETSPNEPAVELTSRARHKQPQLLVASGLWLGGLLLLWFLSRYSSARVTARGFWPEQVALVGLLIAQTRGLTVLVLLLLVFAAVSRVVLVAISWFSAPRSEELEKSSRTDPLPVR